MRPRQRGRRSRLNDVDLVNDNNNNNNNQEQQQHQLNTPSTSQSATVTTTEQSSSSSSNNRNKRKLETKSNNLNNDLNINRNKRLDLKKTLKKATIKFNRACKQIVKLDQKISDLQSSYNNAIEFDRKTFKIVYRMQLATLEGLHEAYIEYIERKVNEIRDLKNKLFGENQNVSVNNDINNNNNNSINQNNM